MVVAIILGLKFSREKEPSKGYSIAVVIVICLFVAAFGWSWGPLGWTIPSEIFPLETRSAGQSITVSVAGYEACFLELKRFSLGSFPTEKERVEKERVVRFVRGLQPNLGATVAMFTCTTLEEVVMRALEGDSALEGRHLVLAHGSQRGTQSQ